MARNTRPRISDGQLELPVAGGGYGEEPSQALLLTVKEAAKVMQIGRDMTFTLVAENKIPAIRLGRHIRIPRASLIAHLQAEAERLPGQAS